MFNNLDEVLRFIKQNVPRPDARVTSARTLPYNNQRVYRANKIKENISN